MLPASPTPALTLGLLPDSPTPALTLGLLPVSPNSESEPDSYFDSGSDSDAHADADDELASSLSRAVHRPVVVGPVVDQHLLARHQIARRDKQQLARLGPVLDRAVGAAGALRRLVHKRKVDLRPAAGRAAAKQHAWQNRRNPPQGLSHQTRCTGTGEARESKARVRHKQGTSKAQGRHREGPGKAQVRHREGTRKARGRHSEGTGMAQGTGKEQGRHRKGTSKAQTQRACFEAPRRCTPQRHLNAAQRPWHRDGGTWALDFTSANTEHFSENFSVTSLQCGAPVPQTATTGQAQGRGRGPSLARLWDPGTRRRLQRMRTYPRVRAEPRRSVNSPIQI
eukprot:357272-Chlamydomonas_euryale.AAC.6